MTVEYGMLYTSDVQAHLGEKRESAWIGTDTPVTTMLPPGSMCVISHPISNPLLNTGNQYMSPMNVYESFSVIPALPSFGILYPFQVNSSFIIIGIVHTTLEIDLRVNHHRKLLYNRL